MKTRLRARLKYTYWRDPSEPFIVTLNADPVRHLITDAAKGYRVFELLQINRPGDLWRYFRVILEQLPERVWGYIGINPADRSQVVRDSRDRYADPYEPRDADQSGHPLNWFDRFFAYHYEDTEPHSHCWLPFREGRVFHAFTATLFAEVQKAQTAVRSSTDVLVLAELALIDRLDHPLQWVSKQPTEITLPGYRGAAHPRQTPAFYTVLKRLLAKSKMRSVALCDHKDLATIRAICLQQRKRANASGRPVGADLIFHMSDHISNCVADWDARAAVAYEGVGFADLIIEPFSGTSTLRGCTYALASTERGDFEGYTRTSGPGWVLYSAATTNPPWCAIDRKGSDDRFHKWTQAPKVSWPKHRDRCEWR